MENLTTPQVFWVNILERDGWLLVNVDGRKLGIIISITEAGQEHLRVAGFHLVESVFVGDRQNTLSVKVERVQPDQKKECCPRFRALFHKSCAAYQ